MVPPIYGPCDAFQAPARSFPVTHVWEVKIGYVAINPRRVAGLLLRGRRKYLPVGLTSASMPQIPPQKQPYHPSLICGELRNLRCNRLSTQAALVHTCNRTPPVRGYKTPPFTDRAHFNACLLTRKHPQDVDANTSCSRSQARNLWLGDV